VATVNSSLQWAAADTAAAKAEPTDAGASFPRAKPGVIPTNAWSDHPASAFSVRCGPNYPRLGRKAPSGPAFGEVVAMDKFNTPRKPYHIMSHGLLRLPKPTPGWSEPYAEFLVVVQMIPMTLRCAAGPPPEARPAVAARPRRPCHPTPPPFSQAHAADERVDRRRDVQPGYLRAAAARNRGRVERRRGSGRRGAAAPALPPARGAGRDDRSGTQGDRYARQPRRGVRAAPFGHRQGPAPLQRKARPYPARAPLLSSKGQRLLGNRPRRAPLLVRHAHCGEPSAPPSPECPPSLAYSPAVCRSNRISAAE